MDMDLDREIISKYIAIEEYDNIPSKSRNNVRLVIETLTDALDALLEDDITEIALNADGIMWAYGSLGIKGKQIVGRVRPIYVDKSIKADISGIKYLDKLDPDKAIKALATFYRSPVHDLNPILEVELPFIGHRFSGIMSPCDTATSFNLRSKAKRIFTLDDYIRDGYITESHVISIKNLIKDRKNILIVGGTGSGKTTFGNAICHAMSELCPDDRVFIIEDTRELQCPVLDKVSLFVPPLSYEILNNPNVRPITAQILLKTAMRRSPDRIIVGEIRDGNVAATLLNAWNSGHPGGITTIHADDAQSGLIKFEQYLESENRSFNPKFLAETIHAIISIQKSTVYDKETNTFKKIRKIEEIKSVEHYEPIMKKYYLNDL